jgi:rSAM/selenodomain-associated transferase 1
MPALITERLIVFTRFPVAGKTKTRLIPVLGEQGAADLQRQMTEHIISTAVVACRRPALTVGICYAGGNAGLMRNWLGPQFVYRSQGQGNLGRRFDKAFDQAFGAGIETVVIIGSDIPEISANIIQQAFEALQKYDLVLGPAHDGGYYLIGLQRAAALKANPHLFKGIKWGSAAVLAQTLQIAGAIGLSFGLLESLTDIDRPEDLHVWQKLRSGFKTSDHVRGSRY